MIWLREVFEVGYNKIIREGFTMKAKVICITREFGSGGRTIGKLVATQLGYDFYDDDLVEKTAESSNFSEEFIEENGESASSYWPWLFKSDHLDICDELFLAERNVIVELAKKGNCVLVGRCADYILREMPEAMSCFIFAEKEFKEQRIVNVYGESKVNIAKRVKDKDRKRKAHYQYSTGRKWGRAFYYDACFNSGRLGIEQTAQAIVNLALNFPCMPKQGDVY